MSPSHFPANPSTHPPPCTRLKELRSRMSTKIHPYLEFWLQSNHRSIVSCKIPHRSALSKSGTRLGDSLEVHRTFLISISKTMICRILLLYKRLCVWKAWKWVVYPCVPDTLRCSYHIWFEDMSMTKCIMVVYTLQKPNCSLDHFTELVECPWNLLLFVPPIGCVCDLLVG